MKLLKLFEEKEEEEEREVVVEKICCKECGQAVQVDSSYYTEEAEEIFCSYECYIKKLNREYFE